MQPIRMVICTVEKKSLEPKKCDTEGKHRKSITFSILSISMSHVTTCLLLPPIKHRTHCRSTEEKKPLVGSVPQRNCPFVRPSEIHVSWNDCKKTVGSAFPLVSQSGRKLKSLFQLFGRGHGAAQTFGPCSPVLLLFQRPHFPCVLL